VYFHLENMWDIAAAATFRLGNRIIDRTSHAMALARPGVFGPKK